MESNFTGANELDSQLEEHSASVYQSPENSTFSGFPDGPAHSYWQQEFAYINLCVGNTFSGIVGFFGNILILFVLGPKRPRTSTDIYRLNLATVDLLFTLTTTIFRFGPLTMTNYDPLKWHPFVCKFWMHGILTFSNVSAWTIVCLTIERLVVVSSPLKAKRWTTRRIAFCAVLLLDLFWPLWYSPLFLVYGPVFKEVAPGRTVMVNSCTKMPDSHAGLLWYMRNVRPYMDLVFHLLIPFIIIMSSNIYIIFAMLQNARFRATMAICKEDPVKQNRSLTVTLLSISFVFLICISPMRIMLIIFGRGARVGNPASSYEEALFMLGWSFAVNLSRLNYAINFILYCLCSAEFRKDTRVRLRSLVPCWKPTPEVPSSRRSSTSSTYLTKISLGYQSTKL